jgi:hypothetical protein
MPIDTLFDRSEEQGTRQLLPSRAEKSTTNGSDFSLRAGGKKLPITVFDQHFHQKKLN